MAASITFQATDTDNTSITSASNYTFALTVASAAGQERLVGVGGIGGIDGDYTAVTIDGQAGTRVGAVSRGANDGTSHAAFVTFYRATGTAGTAINVVATYNGSVNCDAGYCACWSLNDTDTLLASTNAAVNDPTLSTNTASGGVAAAILLGYTAVSPLAAWSGLTEVFDAVRVFGDEDFTGSSINVVTGETPRAISVNMTPDLTGGSVASCCVSFNPDAAAGGPSGTVYDYPVPRGSSHPIELRTMIVPHPPAEFTIIMGQIIL